MGLHTTGLRKRIWVLTRLATTGGEGVTDVSFWAAADWVVVHNVTLGVDSTNSNTRVLASQVDTGKGRGTLAVDDTLWATSGWSSEVSREACAHWPAFLFSTLSIGTTRRWLARVDRLGWSNYFWDG